MTDAADADADDLDELAEHIGRLATDRDLTVGVAESLTGGLIVQSLARAKGSSDWLRGGVVAYSRHVKYDLLDVDIGPVVTERAARQMAAGARRALSADVVVAVTGAGGPDPQDGAEPGTVWLAVDDGTHVVTQLHELEGDPADVCAGAHRHAVTALMERLRDHRHPVERVGA